MSWNPEGCDARMSVRILGSLEVRGRIGIVPLGGTKQRAVFTMLALQCNHVVSVDHLISGLWTGDPPDSAGNALQVYISRLRRSLRTGESGITVRHLKPGYLLELDPERIDLCRFERLTREGLGALPAAPEIAVNRLAAALDLWQGSPLVEFVEEPFAEVEIARLQEQKLAVLSSRTDAELALGRHVELIAGLEQLVTEHPFHEGLHRQLILSLYRSGRQTEALQTYQRMRRAFSEELGIDPGRALQELESAILTQDPHLDPDRPETQRQPGGHSTPLAPPVRIRGVPPRNPHFTGRADQLTRIHSALDASSSTPAVQALYGLGGVGKTDLVIEYAHRFADEYDLIWWIEAEQSVLIPQQLCRLAVRLGLPDHGITADSVDRLLTELAGRTGWLLIFDNAERPEDIAPFRPSGPGHILVTTRAPNWGALGGRVEVDVLDRVETIALLQRRVAPLPENLADALAFELGDLPLAAAQAAAYLEQTGLTPSDYLRRFRTQRAALLAQGDVLGYHGRVDTTWSLALQHLNAEAPAAVALLQVAAFLAAEPIPFSMFADHPNQLQEPLRGTAAAGLDAVADIVGIVVGYSLVHRYHDSFQLHRLVQNVIRDQLPADTKRAVVDQVVALLAATDPGDPNDPGSWPAYATLAPHVLVAGGLGDHRAGARRLMLAIVEYLNARGDTRASRRIGEELFHRWTKVLGADHPDTITVAANLTSALTWLAQHDQARTLSHDILTRSKKVLGADHPVTLRVATNLTFALAWIGKSDQACALGQDALQRAQSALGPDHGITLRLAANLTFALNSQGHLTQADQLGQDTLDRCRRVVGADHPITLVAAAHLALTQTSLGRPDRAHQLADDTLHRSRATLGADHPITLGAAAHLTFLLTIRGEAEQAKRLGWDTLERSRTVLGGDHLITLSSAAVLALALAHADEAEQALDLGVDTLRRSEQTMGYEHLITLTAATAVTYAHIARGDQEQALALAMATLRHAQNRLPPGHLIITALTEALLRNDGCTRDHSHDDRDPSGSAITARRWCDLDCEPNTESIGGFEVQSCRPLRSIR